MQIFRVTKNLEALEIKDGKFIKDVIATDGVYLIVDNNNKEIIPLRGIDSGIAEQFIALKLIKTMKLQLRGFYKTKSFEDIENDPKIIEEILESKIKEGRAIEIKNEEIILDDAQKVQDARLRAEKAIDESRALETCVHKGIIAKNVIPNLLKLENPKGFHRNMTIIGGSVFNEHVVVEKYFTDDIKHIELKKVGNLPNGYFFVDDISARLLIKHGKIEGIDYLVHDDQDLGVNRLMVPTFIKEKLHREGDINILKNAFKKPEIAKTE